tara:strand:+ start:194 stop:1537 length:1344 start_codon:yes stop_codon:yes gene_type:complete
MEAFNFNVDDYTHGELLELLTLTANYNANDIKTACDKLTVQLNQSQDISVEKKREIAFFLDNVTGRLKNKMNIDTTIKINSNDSKDRVWGEKDNPIKQYDSNIIIENPNENAGKNASIIEGREAWQSSSIPPGYINPINVRTTIQSVNIDSRFRKDYYNSLSSFFTVDLPEPQRKTVKMFVNTIEIPLSYYTVSSDLGNNKFIVAIPDESDKKIYYGYIITINDGNYSNATISNEIIDPALISKSFTIKNGITISKPSDLTLFTDLQLVLDITETSNKANFKSNLDKPFELIWCVDASGNIDESLNPQMQFGWLLGYKFNYTSFDGSSNTEHISEGVVTITSPRYAYLGINDYQNNYTNTMVSAYNNSTLDNKILSRIQLLSTLDTSSTHKLCGKKSGVGDDLFTREYFGPVDIQKLDISLYDEFGRLLNLNYADWSMVICFEKLYT